MILVEKLGENLAKEWSKDPLSMDVWRILTSPDPHESRIDRLSKLAESGSVIAMLQLGYLLYFSNEPNNEEPLWFKRAEDRGYIEAKFQLAKLYWMLGNISDANKKFIELCELDFSPACFLLGYNFLKGIRVSEDPVEAENFLKRACNSGHLLARRWLLIMQKRSTRSLFVSLLYKVKQIDNEMKILKLRKEYPNSDRLRAWQKAFPADISERA